VRSKLAAIAVSGSHLISVIWGPGWAGGPRTGPGRAPQRPVHQARCQRHKPRRTPLSGMTGPILNRNKLHRNTPAVRLADSNQKSRRNSHIRSFPSARSEHI